MVTVCGDKAESTATSGRDPARACWLGNRLLVPEDAPPRVPSGTIVVTPWNVLDDVPAGPSLRAESRDVSDSGLSFAHAELLTCRFVAIAQRAEAACESPVEVMLVRLLWCRFTGRGGYVSGGRIERRIGKKFDEAMSVRV